MKSVDELCINTIRFLSVDQVEKANSGHPGLPLGAATMAYVIWDRFLRHSPKHPEWYNRDRFLLSAGHGSALLYSLLHLYGFDVSLDDLKNFRQWESKTPGHPEYGLTPGVEATTGPLGQGFAMGVGMAIAERYHAAMFNLPAEEYAHPIIDHFTYAIVSDGDLMEGIASEAASLAGHLKLAKLIYLYDDNGITIEGSTDLAFSEDVTQRFGSYGWHVQLVEDGNDVEAIDAAIRNAQLDHERPSLIRVKTHIGYGSPKQDSAKAHGEPMGAEAMAALRKNLGWSEETFQVPDEVRRHCEKALDRGQQMEDVWLDNAHLYVDKYPERGEVLKNVVNGTLPEGWTDALPVFAKDDKAIATRAASGKVINALASVLPNLIGGSADLSPSNKTHIDDADAFNGADNPGGRNFHFGVREHAMGGIINGMSLHGGIYPYGSTFLIFSDYMRPSIRLSALMVTPSIWVYTHDSIGVGEDGPTHQPIEHLMSLRAIPNLTVIRPADANETAAAWKIAIEGKNGPVLLALTRQGLPNIDPALGVAEGVARGAWTVDEADGGSPDVVLIGTGSEVALVREARKVLADRGVKARVVSMPSWELFDAQPEDYRSEVLPAGVPKLAVEAGSSRGWRDYVGEKGDIIGLDRFGASAPGKTVFEKLGFGVDNVVGRAQALLGK